jgi:1-acyl-sn-glycerol-3-phosphate acyltransferase
VFVHGSHRAWPPGRKFPAPFKLILAISDPIFPDLGIEDERERRAVLMKSLEGALRALAAEAERHD